MKRKTILIITAAVCIVAGVLIADGAIPEEDKVSLQGVVGWAVACIGLVAAFLAIIKRPKA